MKTVADVLGITSGIDCVLNGDLGSCGEAALVLVGSFVGAAAFKIAAKYAAPWKWKACAKLVSRLWTNAIWGITRTRSSLLEPCDGR